MSIEQAILELAGAIKSHGESLAKMAEANFALAANDSLKLEAYEKSLHDYSSAVAAGLKTKADVRGTTTAEESMLGAEAAPLDYKTDVKPDPELDAAVEKVEADAAAEDATPLDYKADVKPVLLKLFKAKGNDALAGLLKKYMPDEAKPNGDKLTADQLPGILADANVLLAG